MLLIAGAVGAAAVIALALYVSRERLGWVGVGPAVLRTVALGALLLLAVNPGWGDRGSRDQPVVLLDRSLSMGAAGGGWARALDTARALAGTEGTIIGFGAAVGSLDSVEPTDGASRLGDALAATRGLGRPVTVITDGEVSDGPALPPALLRGLRTVLVTREPIPGLALTDVDIPRAVERNDAIPVTLTLVTWGGLAEASAILEVQADGRRLLERVVPLPRGPGAARRSVVLPPAALPIGEHVLTLSIRAAGDVERRDDVRRRVVAVTARPAIVVLVSPADLEGRFLVRELQGLAGAPVRGFARVSPDGWRDMRTLGVVPAAVVRELARLASLLVIRGDPVDSGDLGRRGPVWHWPSDAGSTRAAGEWYVAPDPLPSPLGSALHAIPTDSLPPLFEVAAVAPESRTWPALIARQGRRGSARPVVTGSDSAGTRRLTTLGAGFWRWSFRGGAARDAYRAMLAAGLDWLLGRDGWAAATGLVAPREVTRGIPVVFRWVGVPHPDTAVVVLQGDSARHEVTLHFDAAGAAGVRLEPGTYRWRAREQASSGMTVVEDYSPEFPPNPVTLGVVGAGPMVRVPIPVPARQRWWLFCLAIGALVGEWLWRQRRGLP